MTDEIPVACQLEGPELRAREGAIRELLRSAPETVTERPDGIEVRFPGACDCLPEIAELMEWNVPAAPSSALS